MSNFLLLDILKNREARAEKRDRFRLKINEISSSENEICLSSRISVLYSNTMSSSKVKFLNFVVTIQKGVEKRE